MSDFLSEVKPVITADKLETLSKLCYQLKDLRAEEKEYQTREIIDYLMIRYESISIETIKQVLKKYEQLEHNISQNLIPSVLNECNMSEIKLKTDERIIVEEKIKASIADKRSAQAYAEMIKKEQELGKEYEVAEKNIASLFKAELRIEPSEEIYDLLIEKNIPYDKKLDIHWQTLNKYVKEKMERGEPIPESISVFKYQETKIK